MDGKILIKNLVKLLAALLLLPTVFWVGVETLGAFWRVLQDFQVAVGLVAGAALYCVIHYGGYRFERLYVWGHEATHAVAAMLFGFRVHSMTVHKDSGHVKMDQCNAAVALAPYIVPVYVMLTGLVYGGLSLFQPVEPYRPAFVFVIGFFMAFHFVQTFHTLWEADQPDLHVAGGRIFSSVMIVLGNALLLVGVLWCLFPQKVHVADMGRAVAWHTYTSWKFGLAYMWEWVTSGRS